jgi:hypothetical protein
MEQLIFVNLGACNNGTAGEFVMAPCEQLLERDAGNVKPHMAPVSNFSKETLAT